MIHLIDEVKQVATVEEGGHISEYPNFKRVCQKVFTCLGCVDNEEKVRRNSII